MKNNNNKNKQTKQNKTKKKNKAKQKEKRERGKTSMFQPYTHLAVSMDIMLCCQCSCELQAVIYLSTTKRVWLTGQWEGHRTWQSCWGNKMVEESTPSEKKRERILTPFSQKYWNGISLKREGENYHLHYLPISANILTKEVWRQRFISSEYI